MALPQGWITSKLSELISGSGIFCDGDWVESKDQDPNGEIRLIQLADIGDGFFIDKSNRFLTKEKAIALHCTYLKKGDLLIARMPSPLGRTTLFPLEGEEKYVTVVDVAVYRLGHNLVSDKYCSYMINAIPTRNQISAQQSGTTRKRIARTKLEDIKIPLPPLAEQHRIVAKIDALFSELDKGVEMLQTVRAQLRTYRQAVLKMAFSGQLIRKKWNISSIGAIAEEIKIGPFGTLLHKADYVSGGFPIVNPKHMSNYRIRSEASKTISVEKAEELSSYTIYENDVLIARRGEMGRTAYVSQKENGWLCGTGSMIIRFPKIYNGYLYAMLLSAEQPRKYLVDKSNGTTMDNLNEITIKRLPFPDIPVEDQKYVLSEIESRLSVCDKLEQLVDENLAKAQALRQSLLKKAFAGELVPQDPHDEPAEKLLERIKAMKAAVTKTTTARRAHR